MRGTLRRVAAFRGQLAVLGVLALVGAVLVVGAPRLADHYTAVGLRQHLTGLPHQLRDLTYRQAVDPMRFERPRDPVATLASHRVALPPQLRSLIQDQWYGIQTGPDEFLVDRGNLPPDGFPLDLGLRAQSGVPGAATLTEGRWPRRPVLGEPVEAAVSADAAAALRLRPGTRFELSARGAGLPVAIVGVFTPADRRAPVWAEEPELISPYVPVGEDGTKARAVLLVNEAVMAVAFDAGFPVNYSWRYRLDDSRMEIAAIDRMVGGVGVARQRLPTGVRLDTGLDTVLVRFAGLLAAVRALLVVVQVGVLTTLVGLVLLAARAAVERRREELALLRARGAAVAAIGRHTLAETLVVVPPAVAVGWAGTGLLPGQPVGTGWLAVLLGLATAAAVPTLAMAGHRRFGFLPARHDLATHRASRRRLTAEVSVLLAAAVGAVLLRRRGLSQESGVDLYLAAVPVLLAVGLGILVLRAFPWPLRTLGRLAARARGTLFFLGLTGAGRAAPASVGPVAVMVVAVTTAVFSAVVTTTIDDARARAADAAVGADAQVKGANFTPETTARMAAVPGVRAVAPISVDPSRQLLSDAGTNARVLSRALVVVVDAPAYARVLADSGVDLRVPPALVSARAGAGPAPAVVSPAVAAAVGGGAVAEFQGRLYPFRVAEVAPTFPTLARQAPPFVVLPAQALAPPAGSPIRPTGFLVAGDRVAPAALTAAGDQGQRDFLDGVLGDRATLPSVTTTVTTWAQHRATLERTGVNSVLRFTFAAGAVAGVALALLAVAFAVLAGARARGQVLSRLRTMGMSARQGRGLLLVDLAPLILAAVLAGGAVGVALPPLLAPALGLSAFTEGYAVGVRIPPVLVAALLGVVVVGLVTALAVESAVNRRLRLGEVLRLGEET